MAIISHGIDLVERGVSFGQCPSHDGEDPFEMCSGGDFRNHPSVLLVEIMLGGHHVGADPAAVDDHRGRGFIARGLDRENSG